MSDLSKWVPLVRAELKHRIHCEVRHQLMKLYNDLFAPRLGGLEQKIEALTKAVQASERALSRKFDELEYIVSVSVDELNADIQTLINGYQAVVSERDALKAALAAADATKAAAVADAVAAEDADAQAKIDAADAVVDAANAAAAPPADAPPVDEA